MEDNRFSARVTPSKALYKELGRIQMKKTKNSVLFLILGIVLTVADIVLTYLGGMGGVTIVVGAYLMFFYWLFLGDEIGSGIYKSIHKKRRDVTDTYYFGETSFSVYNGEETSSVKYELIIDAYETEKIFALFKTKNMAYVLPKNGFTQGTAAAFRRFIGAKTGSPVKRIRTKRNLPLRIVAAVLIFAVMLGARIGADTLYRNRIAQPVPFTVENYTIELNHDFSRDESGEGEYDMGVFSNNAGVLVWCYTQEELVEWLGECESAHEYMKRISEIWGMQREDVGVDAQGRPYLEYTEETDEDVWYCYDVGQMQDDCFWLTQFYCFEEYSEEYIGQFIDWSTTIEIK